MALAAMCQWSWLMKSTLVNVQVSLLREVLPHEVHTCICGLVLDKCILKSEILCALLEMECVPVAM